MKYIVLVGIILIGMSCNPCKRLTKKCNVENTIEYIETVVDNPSYTIPDSIYWQLEFECDSNYDVIMRSFEEANTGLETTVEIKEVTRWREDKTKVNRLTVNLTAVTDSITSLNRTIEKLKNDKTTVTVEKEVEVTRNSKFARICIIFSLCAVILFAVWVYLKVKAGALKGLISRL